MASRIPSVYFLTRDPECASISRAAPFVASASDGSSDDGIGDADDISLSSVRQRISHVHAGIGFEGAFDSQENARFIKGNDAAIAFANREGLTVKWIKLRQPELAIELFVQHKNDCILSGCQTALH